MGIKRIIKTLDATKNADAAEITEQYFFSHEMLLKTQKELEVSGKLIGKKLKNSLDNRRCNITNKSILEVPGRKKIFGKSRSKKACVAACRQYLQLQNDFQRLRRTCMYQVRQMSEDLHSHVCRLDQNTILSNSSDKYFKEINRGDINTRIVRRFLKRLPKSIPSDSVSTIASGDSSYRTTISVTYPYSGKWRSSPKKEYGQIYVINRIDYMRNIHDRGIADLGGIAPHLAKILKEIPDENIKVFSADWADTSRTYAKPEINGFIAVRYDQAGGIYEHYHSPRTAKAALSGLRKKIKQRDRVEVDLSRASILQIWRIAESRGTLKNRITRSKAYGLGLCRPGVEAYAKEIGVASKRSISLAKLILAYRHHRDRDALRLIAATI